MNYLSATIDPGGLAISHVPTADDYDCNIALESLVRWDKKNTGHHTQKRSSDRNDFFAKIPLMITSPWSVGGGAVLDEPVCFEVWGRNLSPTGLGCLSFRELMPAHAVDDSAGLLLVDQLLRPGTKVTVGLTGDTQKTMYVNAEVVRIRETFNRVFEFGLHFTGKSGSLF